MFDIHVHIYHYRLRFVGVRCLNLMSQVDLKMSLSITVLFLLMNFFSFHVQIGPRRLSFSGEAPSPIGGAVGPPAGYTADTNGISQKTPTSHAQQNVQQQRDFLILRTQGHAPSQHTNKDRVEDDNQHSQPHPMNIQNDRPPEVLPKGGSSMYADDDEWSEAQSPAPADEPIITVSVKSTPPKASGSANQLSVRSRSPDQVVQDLDTWNSTKTGTPRPPPSPPRSARHSASGTSF